MLPFLFALTLIAHPGISVRDIDGTDRQPLNPKANTVSAVFFVTNDCPISNYYAQEIRRICEQYAAKGLGCSLVYIDPNMTDDDVRSHAAQYGHGTYPKMVDRRHLLVEATEAVVTPQVFVIQPGGRVAYRGRIDDFYAALGRPRRVVTTHDLRDALDAVFAGRPVPNPETKPAGCYIPDLKSLGIKP